MKYFFKCLKHYFDFKGRARRKEFWMFVLFMCILVIITSMIDMMRCMPMLLEIAQDEDAYAAMLSGDMTSVFSMFTITMVVTLLLTIPCYAMMCRRLHDTGRSGWWVLVPIALSALSYVCHGVLGALISLAQFVFLVLFIVWFCQDSQYEVNAWGPCPKTEDGEDTQPQKELQDNN